MFVDTFELQTCEMNQKFSPRFDMFECHAEGEIKEALEFLMCCDTSEMQTFERVLRCLSVTRREKF